MSFKKKKECNVNIYAVSQLLGTAEEPVNPRMSRNGLQRFIQYFNDKHNPTAADGRSFNDETANYFYRLFLLRFEYL